MWPPSAAGRGQARRPLPVRNHLRLRLAAEIDDFATVSGCETRVAGSGRTRSGAESRPHHWRAESDPGAVPTRSGATPVSQPSGVANSRISAAFRNRFRLRPAPPQEAPRVVRTSGWRSNRCRRGAVDRSVAHPPAVAIRARTRRFRNRIRLRIGSAQTGREVGRRPRLTRAHGHAAAADPGRSPAWGGRARSSALAAEAPKGARPPVNAT